jgi:hypothetical protein
MINCAAAFRPVQLIVGIVALALVSACTATAPKPLTGSVSTMEDSWGPFARQCVNTRLSYWVSSGRLSPTEKATTNGECWGFSVAPGPNGSTIVTASIGGEDDPTAVKIVRFLRSPSGQARPAAPGDMSLLAQGSDDPKVAAELAREVGLSERQMIAANRQLDLTIRLDLPAPVDVAVSCHPDGGGEMHGRDTVVLSCTGSRQLHTDTFEGKLNMEGVEEIDVRSGVILASRFSGHMNGERQMSGLATGKYGDVQLLYGLDTEFE